jgi:hypothetical protein
MRCIRVGMLRGNSPLGMLQMNDLEKSIEAFRCHGWRAPFVIFGSLLRRYSSRRKARAIASAIDLQTKFSLIYKARWWDQKGESVSGPGSTLAFTEGFRFAFESFLAERAIKKLFDAPCGDWNWMREVRLPSAVCYLGGEIVPELVADLQKTYARDVVSFTQFDITADRFPNADLWLCRDCLIHLSNADVRKALENFSASGIPYALISNYLGDGVNADIVSGGFRPLDLTKAPFRLPPPEFIINDWPGDQQVRQVCLWRREQIQTALAVL